MQEVWLRRRANDHKDALRLILEPRFQINAADLQDTVRPNGPIWHS